MNQTTENKNKIPEEEAIKYVLMSAREHDVKFIRLWFTDILGTLKGFAITVDELEEVLRNEGCPPTHRCEGAHDDDKNKINCWNIYNGDCSSYYDCNSLFN